MVVPHISEFPVGLDGCNRSIFMCGLISSAIPTAIVVGMICYVISLGIKKTLGMCDDKREDYLHVERQ